MSRYKNLIFTSTNLIFTKNNHLRKASSNTLAELAKQCNLFLISKKKPETLNKLLADSSIIPYFTDILANRDWHNEKVIHNLLAAHALTPQATLLIASELVAEIRIGKELKLDTVWLSADKNVIGYTPTIHLKNLSDLSFYLYN